MGNSKTPLQAIRSYCLECSCGSANTVKECSADDCSLYPYRFGKNPFYRSNMTDESLRRLKENGRRLAEWNRSKATASLEDKI